MSQVTIREALISAVQGFKTPFPNWPVAYDNDGFNWTNPPDQFIEFEVKFEDGSQIGMSAEPKTRYRGTVYVTAHAKEGRGSKASLVALEWFANNLGYKRIPPVQMKEPRPESPGAGKGWYLEQIKISFFSDPT